MTLEINLFLIVLLPLIYDHDRVEALVFAPILLSQFESNRNHMSPKSAIFCLSQHQSIYPTLRTIKAVNREILPTFRSNTSPMWAEDRMAAVDIQHHAET